MNLMPYGLTTSEAQKRLEDYGFNQLVDRSRTSPLAILIRQIKSNFVIYMLVVAIIISLFVGKITTAYTISAVILLVVGVGFVQEYKAEEAVASLKKMLMPVSIVFRDGRKKEISSKEIVPGDILVLGNGEKIPADCVLVESHDLRVNEAALTGESKEISKKLGYDAQIYMGTYIVNGRCLAEVIHTGMNTRFGKVAHLISTAEKELPLQQKVNNIAKYMVFVALIASVATGLLMLFRASVLDASTITEILILVVALSVSAFPEGFPVVLITTLALGAKRMSDKNAIVNRMSIIETLGEVTVICSDKTGTLTRGEMTVKYIFTGNQLYEVEGSGYIGHGDILVDKNKVQVLEHKRLIRLIRAGVMCNDAEIERTGEDNEYRGIGSPTEISLLILGAKVNMFKDSDDAVRINESPFNSDRKMMSVLYRETGGLIVYAKGAPEIILPKCVNLSETQFEQIKKLQEEMAKNSFRTLCLASKKVDDGVIDYDEVDFDFLGLVAMEDPPREEVSLAIQTAMNAGIRVVMVTGDNKETARSISAQIGLKGGIIDGEALDKLSDEELKVVLKDTTIFARVRPEHKIRLVSILKDLGETVAMTGDGVNDAPALKEAHVGIAMGKNGTDVSRTAADLILKDDNFATIISAIAEGRTVYNNIKKFVTYQLSCNLAELTILFIGVLLSSFLGWQTPILLSMQILFMNLVTDNLPAITLGVNPTSNDIMNDKPRAKGNILNRGLLKLLIFTALIMAFLTLLSYFTAFNIFGLPTNESRTIALVTLILVEIVTAFNFRSFRKLTLNRSPFVNKYLILASFISLIATFVILYTPAKILFETIPLNFRDWLMPLGFAFVALVINDFVKVLNLKKPAYISDTK